jgi:hypothetical protein
VPQIGLLQFLFMPLRRTNPFMVLRHLRDAERLGVEISADQVESAWLSGVDPGAVIQAAADARRRGLPENIRGLIEAAYSGVNLSQFVEREYADPDLRTMTALQEAAAVSPAAAAQLADRHLETAAKLGQVIAAGPQSLGQRIGWGMLRSQLEGSRAQELAAAEALLAHLDENERERVRSRLDQAV